MTYLLNRNGNFYYNREVPAIYRDLDPREKIRVALKTTNKREALRKAIAFDDQMEAYWRTLVSDDQKHDVARFGKIVHIARQMGFSYQPMPIIVSLPLNEVVGRTLAVENAPPQQLEAAFGAKEEKVISLTEALEKYWELSRPQIIDKSENQIRKWRNPRIKAVNNFIDIVGDKELKKITKEDMQLLRNWWLDRIEKGLKPGSANKDFIHLKEILKTVSKYFGLKLKIRSLFSTVMMPEDSEKTRLPFTSEQIISILHNPLLDKMDEDAKWLFFAMSETGTRNTEIIGLLPEDIKLDADIPHISIVGRKGRKLKTKHSKRDIPIVGYALDAFRARPTGFPDYRDNPDVLTTRLNKFMRNNDLFPSENHSTYSLRHSFQDRLTAISTPDRVQVQLMGHSFRREDYGLGATLKQKLEYMERISLRLTT